jgi:hypothetical protein
MTSVIKASAALSFLVFVRFQYKFIIETLIKSQYLKDLVDDLSVPDTFRLMYLLEETAKIIPENQGLPTKENIKKLIDYITQEAIKDSPMFKQFRQKPPKLTCFPTLPNDGLLLGVLKNPTVLYVSTIIPIVPIILKAIKPSADVIIGAITKTICNSQINS